MSNTWNGPSPAVKATFADPIATSLHRRAAEQLIAYEIHDSGRRVTVYRLAKRGDTWYRCDLGFAEGADPMNTYINAALEYTQHDGELFMLIAKQIDRRHEDVMTILKDLGRRLDIAVEDVAEALLSLAPRYV